MSAAVGIGVSSMVSAIASSCPIESVTEVLSADSGSLDSPLQPVVLKHIADNRMIETIMTEAFLIVNNSMPRKQDN